MDGALLSTRPGVPEGMTDAEWQTRCDLAALYRVLHSFGWTDLIYTHLSARVPGEEGAFLINHYGQMFDEVTASSLVKMDMAGNVLGGGGRFNKAGFTIHSGVYKARPDAGCVMHTHTRAGATLSTLRHGLRPISQDVLEVWDDLGYHDYGVPSSVEECEALGRSCAKANAVVLLNHGLLSLGPTIPAAFVTMYYLERACQVEIASRSLGEAPVEIAAEIQQKAAERQRRIRQAPDYGQLEWDSVLRMLERQGVDYRH
jgi:ribulose-5-phosphate 4-epimerase/fuculose-1-phosphate aldolase